MMTERFWIPTEYLDEWCPPGRATPSDWILGVVTDAVAYDLHPMDADRENSFQLTVKPGDIMGFHCCDPLGRITVTFFKDGSYKAYGDVPAHANSFWIPGDPDTLASSLDEFAKNTVDLGIFEDGETECPEVIGMSWWSDDIPHKLIVTADGPRFELVSPAEARQ